MNNTLDYLDTPEKRTLKLKLEEVEFRFEEAGLPVRAWIGQDVRTGRSWLGINDEQGELVRIGHNDRWMSGTDRWSVYNAEGFSPITDSLESLTFGEALTRAIAEAKGRV